MAQATASLSLDASKATEGARKFQAAARAVLDADRSMKRELSKAPPEMNQRAGLSYIPGINAQTGKAVGQITQQAMGAKKASDAAASSLITLLALTRFGGVAGGAVMIGETIRRELHAAADEMNEFSEAAQEALGGRMDVGESQLVERLAKVNELIKRINDASADLSLSGMFKTGLNEATGDKRGQDLALLEKFRYEISDKIAEISRERVGLLEDEVRLSKEKVEQDRIQLRLREQIAQIESRKDLTEPAKQSLIADAEHAANLQSEEVGRRYSARRGNIEAQRKITELSRRDRNNGYTQSVVLLEKAQQDASRAQDGTIEEQEEANLALEGAEEKVRQERLKRITGPDGRIMRPSQIARTRNAEGRVKRENQRREANLAKNDNLYRVHRDTSGRIISGIDVATGERRAPSAEYLERDMMSRPGGEMQRRIQAGVDETKAKLERGLAQRRIKSGVDETKAKLERGLAGRSWQDAEMDYKQREASRLAEITNKHGKALDGQIAKQEKSGDRGQEYYLSKIEGILSSWDKEE